MALINCSKCGKQISDKAPSCPHCGEVFSSQSLQQNVNNSAVQPQQPNVNNNAVQPQQQPNVNYNVVQPYQQPANGNLQMQAAAKKPMSSGTIVAVIIAVLVVIITIAAVVIVSVSSSNQTNPNVNVPTYQNQGNAQQNQGNASNNQGNIPDTSIYSVKINVTCIENIAKNKYDVDVIIDGETISTLPHGKSDTYTVKLEEGSHTIEFSVNGKTMLGQDVDTENAVSTFYVDEDKSFSYTVKCTWGDNIEIQKHS